MIFSSFKKHYTIWVAGLMVAVIVIRIIYCLYAFNFDRDSITYIAISQKIYSGDFIYGN